MKNIILSVDDLKNDSKIDKLRNKKSIVKKINELTTKKIKEAKIQR